MEFLAWFTFFAAMAWYYRFLLILFKHLNESKTLKIFYSFIGGFLTIVLAKFIQVLLGIVESNLASDGATDYAIWFGIMIGLIIIYEAIFRMIITRRDFREMQLQQNFEDLESLLYKVDDYVKRGDWNQANQLYAAIKALDIEPTEIIFRCLEFGEKHETIGNLEASKFWYEKAG
ncbi:hypothetical protein FJZ31_04010 [Candidatus Poribacteria bacterium]|nr:hypothetical protein [Candidatus Poribacteria bacterium]